jgi:integrase
MASERLDRKTVRRCLRDRRGGRISGPPETLLTQHAEYPRARGSTRSRPPPARRPDHRSVKIQARLLEGDLSVLRPAAAAPTVRTVAEYAEPWPKSLTKPRAVTVEAYRLRLNVHILPLIGHLPLTDLTRDRVRTLIAELMAGGNRRASKDAEGRRRPLARGTLKGLLNILSGMLERAVEDGLVDRNPARGLAKELPASATAAEVEEIEVFTPEELSRLLATAGREYPDYYAFVLCLARSGVRLGEAVALEWRDVDFDRRVAAHPPLGAPRSRERAQEWEGPPRGNEPPAHPGARGPQELPGGRGRSGGPCCADPGIPAPRDCDPDP